MKHDQPAAEKLDLLGAASPQLRQILRRRIIRNDFEPGAKISESVLAKAYSVSRQPVREAFITLVNENLLEIRPQRGTFVKRIDLDAVLNARFIREAVEADIVRELARTPNAELVVELKRQLKTQLLSENRAPDKFIALDEKFHRTLASALGVSGVWEYLDLIKAQVDRVRIFAIDEFPIDTIVEQHTKIVEGIECQNPDLAESALRTHLRDILSSIPKIKQLFPQYFELKDEATVSHAMTTSTTG